jgi:hypothetical protein
MNSNQAHQQEKQTVEMKKTMEGILYEQGANLVFSGHVHAYERSVPAFNGQPEPKRGITYINIGDGGNQEGHSNDWVQPSPAWSAYRDGKSFGHGNLVIENATHARFDWVRDRDAEFVHGDSVTICNSVLMDASC